MNESLEYKLEYIEWEDVTSSGSAWYEKDEMEEWGDSANQAFVVRQVGFVLKETDRYILLCSHYHPHTEIVHEQFGHLQKILKSLVIKRKKLDNK